MKLDRNKRIKILVVIIAIVAVAAIYFWLYYQYNCPNLACFNDHLGKCDKVTYLKDAPDAAWYYEIKGLKNIDGEKYCKVDVTIKQIRSGYKDSETLEGLTMDCYIKKGLIVDPEDDISQCHGPLKEQMQTLVIQKLHEYVLNNLGKIEEEAVKII